MQRRRGGRKRCGNFKNRLKIMFVEGGEGRATIGYGRSLFSTNDAEEKSMIDAITNLKKKHIYLTGNKICDLKLESSDSQLYDGKLGNFTRFQISSGGQGETEDTKAESVPEETNGKNQCGTNFFLVKI